MFQDNGLCIYLTHCTTWVYRVSALLVQSNSHDAMATLTLEYPSISYLGLAQWPPWKNCLELNSLFIRG